MSELQISIPFPFFVSKGWPEPKYQLYRLDSSQGRRYYRFDEEGNVVWHFSVTTMLHATLPTAPQLIKWIAEKGYEESQEEMNDKADYGTLLHILCQRIIVLGKMTQEHIKAEVLDFAEKNKIEIKIIESWLPGLKSDLLSFVQFVVDYKIKPLAVEPILASAKYGFAGAIDLPCEMTITEDGLDYEDVYKTGKRKGQPREVKKEVVIKAVIDIKSGRKGFWESHEIQLHCYKHLIEENFPHIKVDRLYNWSPKDWRDYPTYNLKDQTYAKSASKIPHLVEIYKTDFAQKDQYVKEIKGEIDIDNGAIPNVYFTHINDYVKGRK
jgi:hypothetical protein